MPGYHIEDQQPGRQEVRPPGRQGAGARRTSRSSGSTPRASSSTSWGSPGIIVARTDAEAATLLDGRGDERDQPFILGATNARRCRRYKVGYLALLRRFHDAGVDELNGHLLYAVARRGVRARPTPGSTRSGVDAGRSRTARGLPARRRARRVDEPCSTRSTTRCLEAWEAEAGLKTYGEAVADVLEFRGRARASRSR